MRDNFPEQNFQTLGKVMDIYNYCTMHLSDTSFLNQEGTELHQTMDSLQTLIRSSGFRSLPLRSQDAALTQLPITMAAFKMYQKCINRLQWMKNNIEYAIKDNFIKFDELDNRRTGSIDNGKK